MSLIKNYIVLKTILTLFFKINLQIINFIVNYLYIIL